MNNNNKKLDLIDVMTTLKMHDKMRDFARRKCKVCYGVGYFNKCTPTFKNPITFKTEHVKEFKFCTCLYNNLDKLTDEELREELNKKGIFINEQK